MIPALPKWLNILLLPMVMLLSSCYIPYGYITKIQISKDGRYEFNYQGRLLSASFLSKLSKGELTPEKEDYEAEKAVHVRELNRQGFNNIEYVFPASYKVRLDRKGNLFKERLIAFPTRQGAVLIMKLMKDNQLSIQTREINEKYIEELELSNVNFIGNVVIWSDIEVTYHNATTLQPGTPDAYVWEFKNLRDTPLKFDGKMG